MANDKNLCIKQGKVVVVLAGRFAGRKALVVKTFDDASKGKRKFGHALVAGIERYPRRITKSMDKKKIARKSTIKPFVKYVNYNHILPTRYVADLDLAKVVDENKFKENRTEVKKSVKKIFEERYLNQKDIISEKKANSVNYFFQKLKF